MELFFYVFINREISVRYNKYLYVIVPSPIQYIVMKNILNESLLVENNEGNKLLIDFMQVRRSSLIFRALNHKLRQDILHLLRTEGKLTVTEIYVKLKLEQSVASQHLAILRRSQFVKTQRNGKYIYYLLNYNQFQQISTVNQLLN